MLVLAIDPGRDCGFALLLGSSVALAQRRLAGSRNTCEMRRVLAEGGPLLLPQRVDLLVLEIPQRGGGRSIKSTASVCMTAGALAALVPYQDERLEVPPNSWNHKGNGERKAALLLKRLGAEAPGDDAKTALGLLIWGLEQAGENAAMIESVTDWRAR